MRVYGRAVTVLSVPGRSRAARQRDKNPGFFMHLQRIRQLSTAVRG